MKGHHEKRYGLIAQEVEEIIGKNNGIVSHDKEIDRYAVCYSELIAPLIKAVQTSSEKCNKNYLTFNLTISDVGCITSKKHGIYKKSIKGYDVMVEMKDVSLIKNGTCGMQYDAFITGDSLYIKTTSSDIAVCQNG